MSLPSVFPPSVILKAEHISSRLVQQLHGTEFPALIWLGSLVGMRLWTTLERYPTEPATDWPYKDFAQPPDSLSLRSAEITHIPRAEVPIPGLRAVLYHEGLGVVIYDP